MTVIRRLFALAAVIAVGAAFMTRDNAMPADLHLRLLKSEPAADTTLDAAPDAIHLWFSEAPEVRVTTVQVKVGAETLKLEDVHADAEDDTHLIAAVDSAVSAGAWTVAWRTMSRDGHVVSGEVAFRVRAQR